MKLKKYLTKNLKQKKIKKDFLIKLESIIKEKNNLNL